MVPTANAPSRNQFLGFLFLYFAMQVVLRCVLSPAALELDEAELVVTTQKWSWGYSSQPPLYTWLQILFFKAFGVSVFPLALLKNLLLFGVYTFTFFNARLVTRNPLSCFAAAASVLFFPEVAWQSQCDRTHSVLALFFVNATLFFFLKITAGGRLRDFIGLGLCGGLGLLSKYNDAFFLVGLLLAAASLAEFRRVFRDWRMLLSALLLVAVFLPNALWMWTHPELALLTSSKLHIAGKADASILNLVGAGKTLKLLAIAIAPVLLLPAMILWRPVETGLSRNQTPGCRLLWRAGLMIVGVILLVVVVFRVTEIRERWLQPMLIFVPILSIAYFEHHLDRRRLRRLFGLAGLVMLTVTVGIAARVVFASQLKVQSRLNSPFDSLSVQMKDSLAEAPVVITETALYSGNLRLNLPGRIYCPPEWSVLLAPDAKSFALVWDATKQELPLPKTMEFLVAAGADFAAAQPRYFSAPHRFQSGREMRLGVVILQKEKNGWPITRGVR